MAVAQFKRAIPNQTMNEHAAVGPIQLAVYLVDPKNVRFSAALQNGAGLPAGLIVTEQGELTGIPADNTTGNYIVILSAQNSEGQAQAEFRLVIKPILTESVFGPLDIAKTKIWQALQNKEPIPELSELLDRPVTEAEIYYLLERWAMISIWDALNLDAPSEKQPLPLADLNEHYEAFDRGSCIVVCPKDLYSHERTLADGLQAACILAQEAFNRRWTVELTGFDKLTRAAWVELQQLSEKYDRSIEIINYEATVDEVKLIKNSTILNLKLH